MKAHRYAPWLWSLVAIAGLGLLAGAGISYAQAPHRSTSSPAGRVAPSIPSRLPLASVNNQNKHFFHIHGRYAKPRLGEPAVRMQIPALHVDSPVIPTGINASTQQWQVADWAVGYLTGSAYPGTCTVFNGQRDCSTDVAAHDDIKGELFKQIGTLRNGDQVYLYTKHTIFTYVVNGQQVVDPSDGAVLNSPVKEVVMITCKPYWVDTQRLVVTAKLQSERAR